LQRNLSNVICIFLFFFLIFLKCCEMLRRPRDDYVIVCSTFKPDFPRMFCSNIKPFEVRGSSTVGPYSVQWYDDLETRLWCRDSRTSSAERRHAVLLLFLASEFQLWRPRNNENIVAYRPVDGRGPRSQQRDNGCCLVTAGKHINNTRAIDRQLLGKRVPATKDTRYFWSITIEMVFSM
jgi:hypothetical protein